MCKHGRHTWKVKDKIIIRIRVERIGNDRKPRCTTCGEKAAQYEYIVERKSGNRNWLSGLFCTSECAKQYHARVFPVGG